MNRQMRELRFAAATAFGEAGTYVIDQLTGETRKVSSGGASLINQLDETSEMTKTNTAPSQNISYKL